MAIHYLNINNKELYVETHGKMTGKAILYLHGGPGEGCFDFSMNQTHRLNNFFRLVVIDQRGVCRSEEIFKEESFGINHLIEDCEELRIQLGISKWSIIGHSFGGYLAVLYANRYPFKLIENGRYDHFQYTDIDKKKEVDMIDKELRTDAYFQKKVFSLKEYFDDFTELLREIQKPTLIIAGKSDHAVGPNHHLTFPCENAVIHYINGGHHPYIENQDVFKEAVLSFVNDKKTV
ncbi:alpha/beta hydrolase [Niallia circulans]|jgi:proline iminopeptidase|uniref:alpha/beta fold hydrolase n=1 Tax=Niallia TaxID=2837506 RepID=UPI000F45D203|nr:alpha/beta hydrolase [Niallia circulans]AYV66647.1 alpha/beta hydrolase [Niallia circulans]